MIGFYKGRQKRNNRAPAPLAVVGVRRRVWTPGAGSRVRCFMLELPFMLGPARVGGRSREIVDGGPRERIPKKDLWCFHSEPREN